MCDFGGFRTVRVLFQTLQLCDARAVHLDTIAEYGKLHFPSSPTSNCRKVRRNRTRSGRETGPAPAICFRLPEALLHIPCARATERPNYTGDHPESWENQKPRGRPATSGERALPHHRKARGG